MDTIDHPSFIVSDFKKKSIGLKRVDAVKQVLDSQSTANLPFNTATPTRL